MNPALRAKFEEAGLGGVVDAISELAKPSIRLIRTAADEETMPVGCSKLGGCADLPAGEEWPRWDDSPLTLVAQVNFAETAAFDVEGILPKVGTALFFFDAVNQPWGFDPAARGSCRVFYHQPGVERRRAPPPDDLPEIARSYACALAFHNEVTTPAARSRPLERLRLSDADHRAYCRVMGEESIYDKPNHRLLGHPAAIQGDMQLECQLVTHGLFCGTASGYEDPRAAALEAGADDWQLLLQVDCDDWASFSWGDHGRIYFWIRRDDLAAGHFDNVWLILQCY